jgi:predicted RNA-binding protein with PUA-like domain
LWSKSKLSRAGAAKSVAGWSGSHHIQVARGNGSHYLIAMAKQYWLVKQEPEAYSWTNFLKEGKTVWTGVRNFQARNNLRAMKKGDLVFFYHSVSEKQVVGVARVDREAYPDPTSTEGDWCCVDLVPVKSLQKPVSLEIIKSDKTLKDLLLVRNSRLSVSPLNEEQFRRVLALAETKI